MRKLKAFTWGYSGWGSESKHFDRAAGTLEKKRGFSAPVFVDLRYLRKGRAANFKGAVFADIVGSDRYLWMKRLGNKAIESKGNQRIEIADPSAARDLLDLIVECARSDRRVIMFCACPQPLCMGRLACHRVIVAELLIKEARRRGLPIELSEWPGEAPVSLRVKATEMQEKAIDKRLCHIPLGPVNARIPSMATLGWGSKIHFETSWGWRSIVTGPAEVQKGQWRLGVYVDTSESGQTEIAALSRSFVEETGFGAHSIRG